MRNIKIVLLGIAGVLAFVFLCSMGVKPGDAIYKEGEKVTVSGLLRLVGNEPFTRLVIQTTNNVNIFLPDNIVKKNTGLVTSLVTAEGVFHIETIYSANHKYKIREFQLSNVVSLKKIPPSQD